MASRDLQAAAEALARASYAIALVGAGISVESGIPPFRGVGGLWTKHGEPPMDGYQRFLGDPAAGWRDMLARRNSDDEFTRALRDAAPNEAHFALARLEGAGVIRHTITKNVDNLHFLAGSIAVTEIHGNRTKLRCIGCGQRWPVEDVDLTELPPACTACGELVKSDTVMFGEPIPETALRECHAQASRADCILVVGTSATVFPAASFTEIVLERGGAIVEVNAEPTPLSRHAAASLRGAAGVVLPQLAETVAGLREGARTDPRGDRR